MQEDLFRKEAVNFKLNSTMGDVYVTSSPKEVVLFLFLIGIVAVAILFLFLGTYTKKEVARGFLTPEKGAIGIYATSSGLVATNYFEEGDIVKKGDSLLEITTGQAMTLNTTVNQKLIDKLEERILLLKKEIKDREANIQIKEQKINQSIVNKKKEIEQIQKEINLRKDDVSTSISIEKKYKNMQEKGLIVDQRYIEQYKNKLQAQLSLETTKRLMLNKIEEISNLKQQLKDLPILLQERKQEIKSEIIKIEESSIKLNSEDKYILKAPVSGRVTNVRVKKGGFVNSNRILMTIMPENINLYAELYLPSKAIGFIEKNQKVLINYDAFPSQQFGMFAGHISEIAKTVIYPQEIDRVIESKEPMYRIIVKLDDQNLFIKDREISLQAGMLLTANVILL